MTQARISQPTLPPLASALPSSPRSANNGGGQLPPAWTLTSTLSPPFNPYEPARASAPSSSYYPQLPRPPGSYGQSDDSSNWNSLSYSSASSNDNRYSPKGLSTSAPSSSQRPFGGPATAAASSSLTEPWTPKPRVWNEQPLFDEVQSRTSSRQSSRAPPSPQSSKMQSYQGQYMSMPSQTSSVSQQNSYNLPQHNYGGMENSFPDFMTSNPYAPAQTQYGGQLPELSAESSMFRSGTAGSGSADRAHVGPAEYAQALEAYRHIRAALPHVRALEHPGPPASGQPYRSIIDSAQTALGVLSGCPPVRQAQAPGPSSNTSRGPSNGRQPGGPDTKRPRVSNGEKGDKPATYCRGCGATETPEWRRGPLGPRTLCNACGLVHMKMMRKKKKAEEKAAQAAAASQG